MPAGLRKHEQLRSENDFTTVSSDSDNSDSSNSSSESASELD